MKEKDLAEITDHILSLKTLFYRAVGRQVLTKSPIPPAAFYVVHCLKKHGDLHMSEIGKHLGIPKPNVTALIDKLIDEKLVERLPDKNDRRVVKIRLTKKGYLFIEKNKLIIIDHIKERLRTLTDKELDTFNTSLNNLKNTLLKILTVSEENKCEKSN